MSWYTPATDKHIRKERERARLLKASAWWKGELAKGVCHYCGGHFKAHELTMDHVIPVARGGTSTRGNVVPACLACNQSKAAQTSLDKTFEALGLSDDIDLSDYMDM